MAKGNNMDEEWKIVHHPTIQINTQGVVSGLENLTITTKESRDSFVLDAELTKYNKQERLE
jgi:hypothetical protein